MDSEAAYSPNQFVPPTRLPDVMQGSDDKVFEHGVMINRGPRRIYPWGREGYEHFTKHWEPVIGEDIRDLRDAEELGREILAKKNGS